MRPKVFVIIVHLNGKTLLAECLDSLKKVNYPCYEVVVVDNKSSDGTRDFLRTSYPWVKLLENGTNLGFGGGSNVGIHYALRGGADYVLLLNNDTLVDPDLINELVAAAEDDPIVGITGAKIYYHDRPDRLWFAGGSVNLFTGLIRHQGIRKIDQGQYDQVREADYVTGCCLLIKREVITRIGAFNPLYYPAYYEDVDLCLRAKNAGYRIVFVPWGRIWHKISASSGGAYSLRKICFKVRNYFKLLKIHAKPYHWLTLSVLGPPLLMRALLQELFRSRFQVLTTAVKGFLELVRSFL